MDIKQLFVRMPDEVKRDFRIHCIDSNVKRYMFLSLYSFTVQILLLCFHVFIGSYEEAYGNPYLFFSIAYILLSGLIYFLLFRLQKFHFAKPALTGSPRLRRRGSANSSKRQGKSDGGIFAAAFRPAFQSVFTAEALTVFYLSAFLCLEFGLALLETELYASGFRIVYVFMIPAFLHCDTRKRLLILFSASAAAMLAVCAILRYMGLLHYNQIEAVIIFSSALCAFFAVFRLNNALVFFLERSQNRENLIRLNELNYTLQGLSKTDSLTNINNRRSFDAQMPYIWDECRRTGSPVTLLMIDIDHFKLYNDHLGHMRGDECLKMVAACIKNYFTRATDFVARYGGEEFVAVMPHTSVQDSLGFIEELKNSIENMQIPSPKSPVNRYVTVSIGAACLIPDITNDFTDLVDEADRVLYEAKNSGRNKVVAAFCSYEKNEAIKAADEAVEGGADLTVEQIVEHIFEDSEESSGITGESQLKTTPREPLSDVSPVISFFTVDAESGELTFSGEIVDFLDIPDVKLGNMGQIMPFIHPDDIPSCKEFINDIFETPAQETKSFMTLVKMRNLAGEYIPVSILCVIINTKLPDREGEDWFVRLVFGALIEARPALRTTEII